MFLLLVVFCVPAMIVAVGWWRLDPQAVVDEINGGPAAGPLDGQGRAGISPDFIPANSEGNSFELVFTAGADGVAEGGGFQFYLPSQVVDYQFGKTIEAPIFNNWWYFLNPLMYTAGFYSVRAPEGVRVRLEDVGARKIFRMGGAFLKSTRAGRPVMNMKEMNRELSRVRVRVVGGKLEGWREVAVTIGAGGRLKTPHYPTHVDVAVESDVDGDGSYGLIAEQPILSTHCRARELRVFAPSTVRPGEVFNVAVQSGCVDIYPEPDPTYEARIELESDGLDVPRYVEIRKGDGGKATFSASVHGEGVYRITACDEESGFESRSNPIVCRAAGPRLYWGDVHRHSILSDGEWKPGTVFGHARYIERLDFASVSDHDLSQPTYYMVPDRDLTRVPGVRHREGKWDHLESVAASFNEPGRFAALAGYEWTSHETGHRNVYFKPGTKTEYLNHLDPPGDTVDSTLEFYEAKPVVIIPHHPAWRGGEEMGDKIVWGDMKYTRQKLVEVYSQHGASEYHGTPFPMHANARVFIVMPRGVGDDEEISLPWYVPMKGYQPTDASPPGRGNYVREALAAGRRLTLVAGSDAHFTSFTKMSYPNGLVAAWAPGLTDEAIWDAMDRRLVYGTTGARIFVEFFVEGRPIGSEVKVDGAPLLEGYVAGTAPLEKVEVVRFMDGLYENVFVGSSEAEEIDFKFEDGDFRGDGFYYLRATQADGHIAWAGPTWVAGVEDDLLKTRSF